MRRTFEKASVLRAVDGDTFEVAVDLGFHASIVVKVRVRGIDTEEVKDKDPAKAKLALEQKAFAAEFEGKECGLCVYRQDLYGRWESDVFFNGEDYEWLIKKRFGEKLKT